MKRSLIIILVATSIGLVEVWWWLWLSQHQTQPDIAGQVTVVTSLYPWQFLAEQIGGDAVLVNNIVPAGADPHDFAPLPQDLEEVYASDLLLVTGQGLDPWAEELVTGDFVNPDHLTLVMTELDESFLAEAEPGDSDEHDNEVDPHIWLDPVIMQTEAERIAKALRTLDPTHATDYGNNADAVISRLVQLDQDYQTGLQQCAEKTIIVSHDAFTYLARRYDITTLSIVGLNPNASPSPQTLEQLITTAKEHQIEYIFFETLGSPELSETLAAEVGAQTLVLDPVEGLAAANLAAGADYISIMQQNLANLQLAIQCQ